MSGALRLGLFAALLAVVAGAAALLGDVLDPDARGEEAEAAAQAAPEPAHAEAEPAAAHTEAEPAAAHAGATDAPRGLAVAAGGLRLVAERTTLRAGHAERFSFRVVNGSGRTVRDFEVEHERRMHLIVVRRDLSGYQHLHPRQAADGSWAVRLRLPEAGAYRAYADFARRGEPHTLGVDLTVPGDFQPRPLPRPATTAHAGDEYEVELDDSGGDLRFVVRRDGRVLPDIEPYLGARGHLVVLREGDLAYLHVHPESGAGRDIRFGVQYPSEGRYGLFLQFKHEGRVHTAAFSRDTEDEEVSDGHGH